MALSADKVVQVVEDDDSIRMAIERLLNAAGLAVSQGAIMDRVANKVVTRYQGSTCEQLWAQKSEPKSAQEQKAVAFLKSDPAARAAFLNKVAGPIANKLFECCMIA